MTFYLSVLIRIALLLLLDFYTWQAVKTVFPDKPWIKWGYWGFHILLYIAMALLIQGIGQIKIRYSFWFFSAIIALYVPKLLIVSVLLMEDITRIVRWIWVNLFPSDKPEIPLNTISRARFLSQLGLIAGAVPFLAILNGMIRTKYDYKVNRIKVPVKDLPQEFEGFTITQISDLHTGSFDSKAAMERGIDLVNAQNSDTIMFTGDLVNFKLDEVEGFKEIYSKLKAKEGVFSVLGNHDYYGLKDHNFSDKSHPYFQKIKDIHSSYGWQLLMNQHALIRRGEKSLAVIGVENQGKKPAEGQRAYFPREGKLPQAYAGAESAEVKVLMSHDPSHWDEEVITDFKDIQLTLSGHTHGFQFGIEIPGLKWSPAKLMYPRWAGLYQDSQQHLYVNRGFGFLGFSGRVGIRPEIAVLELVKA
ncbi:MAG: metallophosphoesterase [Bacteroidia bacterium]|nr:metallophosphoesterase [Bacteroidia bacterium]